MFWRKPVFTTLALMFASLATADNGVWHTMDAPDNIKYMDDIAIGYDAYNSRFIFIADSSESGSTVRSSDDGTTWQIIDSRNTWEVETSWDFANITAIIPGGDIGCWISYNANDQEPENVDFHEINGNLNESNIVRLEFVQSTITSPDDDEFAAYIARGDLYSGGRDLIYKTVDGGQTWESLPADIPPYSIIWDLKIYQPEPDIVVCGGQIDFDDLGVFRTTNGGEDWNQIVDNSTFGATGGGIVTALEMPMQDSKAIYVACVVALIEPPRFESQIWKTVDGGENWFIVRREMDGGENRINNIKVVSTNSSTFTEADSVFLTFRRSRPFWSTVGGGNWSPRFDGMCIEYSTGHRRSIVQDPRTPNLLMANTDGAPFITEDYGETWREVAQGGIRTQAKALAVVASHIFVGSDLSQGSITTTSDNFQSQKINFINEPKQFSKIIVNPYAAQNVWAVARSTTPNPFNGFIVNAIDAFSECPAWEIEHYLAGEQFYAVDLTNENGYDVVYAGGYRPDQTGFILYSLDDGRNWNPISFSSAVKSISTNRTSDNRMLAGTASHGAYRRVTGQFSFESINGGLTNQNVVRAAYQRTGINTGYVGTPSGVFRSTNLDAANANDVMWNSANTGLADPDVLSMLLDPVDESIILVATKDGSDQGHLYISADSARTWLELSENLEGLKVWDIACDDDDNSFYYAGTDNGVYKMANPVKSGTLETTQTWGPGTIIVNGDVTVPAGVTLNIAPGTCIQVVYDFDKLEGGFAPELCEIIVEGTLNAYGADDDSILFVASSEQLRAAQPGDWYGIRFMPGSSGSFDYCAIRHAINGIEIDNDPTVTVNHSLVKSCEIAGIDSYKGYLDVLNSRIDDNKIYGIYSYMSVDSIYNTKLVDNEDYGIKMDTPLGASDSSYVLYDSISNPTSPNNQAGIMIRNHDRVRLYKSRVLNYENAVICYNSDVVIRNCNLGGGGEVGVYSQQLSRPSIRTSYLGSNTIGVKTTTYASANIGKGSSDYGNCSFPYCTTWYIYHYAIPAHVPWVDTLWAQYNYYGWPLDTSKFRRDNANVIVYFPPLRNPPANPRLDPNQEMPQAFSFSQNFPNPFNPQTTIRFTLEAPAFTTVMIYNILGQQVSRLVSEELDAGEHAVVWNGRDEAGSPASSGIYFYTIQAGEHFESKKMVMVR